jgi:hypothetical protein
MRPTAPFPVGKQEISRFSRGVFLCMLRVFDHVGLSSPLAIPRREMVPSISSNNVGVPENGNFAAQYLACTYPCQRFAANLAIDGA